MTATAAAPSLENYERLHVLMDVVDTVRHAQDDAARAAGEAMDEEALVDQVRRIYASQGLAVDEATVRQGLELMKSRRFEFTPPQDGWAVRAARAYVSRGQWGPKVLAATGLVACVTAAVLAVVASVGVVRENRWASQAAASVAEQTALAKQAGGMESQARALPLAPASVAQAAQAAGQALDLGLAALAQVPALPAGEAGREAYYEQDPDRARAALEARQARLAQARQAVDQAGEHLKRAGLIQSAMRQAGVFGQPVPEHLEGLRGLQELAYTAAANRGDPAGMRAAIDTLERAVALDLQRESMLEQAGALATADAVRPSLDEARQALAAGNLDAAQALLEGASGTLEVLPLSYTLRIVSEPGEKTGVWRYYGEDRSTRSFYIVVDALDATGKPVVVPVRSVEDQSLARVSRFAVRVPESVYDAVGQDKGDNGIVDRADFGRKQAGQLEPEYAFEVSGGAITQW